MLWWLLLRAASAFEAKHGRSAGSDDASVAGDVVLLRKELDLQVFCFVLFCSCFVGSSSWQVADLGITLGDEARAQQDDCVQEMVRYGASELHNIAAFQGGVVSLEIIKLITHQWVPLKSTFIFNGITGTACSLDI